MTTNQIAWADLREKIRHDQATETETAVHNRETERQGRQSLDVSWFTAQENQRTHLVNESLTAASLAETVRSHKVNENIAVQNLNETIRSHQANELLGVQNLQETIRSHQANELLGVQNLDEQIRHNQVTETETGRHNLIDERNRLISAIGSVVSADSKAVSTIMPFLTGATATVAGKVATGNPNPSVATQPIWEFVSNPTGDPMYDGANFVVRKSPSASATTSSSTTTAAPIRTDHQFLTTLGMTTPFIVARVMEANGQGSPAAGWLDRFRSAQGKFNDQPVLGSVVKTLDLANYIKELVWANSHKY